VAGRIEQARRRRTHFTRAVGHRSQKIFGTFAERRDRVLNYGAAFFLLLREALSLRLGDFYLLVFGILFLVVVIAVPGGFVEAIRALGRRPEERTPL